MSTQTGRSGDEDDGIHDRFKEHDDHGASDAAHAVQGGDQGDQDTANDGVDGKKQRCADDCEKSRSDKSTDGEEDQTV